MLGCAQFIYRLSHISELDLNQQNERHRRLNGQKVEKLIDRVKYLGTCLSKDGTCSAAIRVMITSAMATMARLDRIWRSNTQKFRMQVQVLQVCSVVSILYGCETWTLLTDSENKIQVLETKRKKRLRISCLEHKTGCGSKINYLIVVGPTGTSALSTVKRRKLSFMRLLFVCIVTFYVPFFLVYC